MDKFTQESARDLDTNQAESIESQAREPRPLTLAELVCASGGTETIPTW